MPLHRTELGAASADRAFVILHGILGRGNNWRSFGRWLTEQHPRYRAVLVDLRAHGDSQDTSPPDDLAHAADDVEALRAVVDLPIDAVLGHSFGGKVALSFLTRTGAPPRHLFVVDSLPGARPDRRGSEDTERVFAVLEALPARFDDRRAFIAHVERAGITTGVAAWLAQNLVPAEGGGLHFGLDLDRIGALLADYFVEDLWPVLDPPPGESRVDVVVGGRSSVFAEEDRARLAQLASAHPGRVHAHVLPDAGHWVHVDDPDGLAKIVSSALGADA